MSTTVSSGSSRSGAERPEPPRPGRFRITATDGLARTGRLELAHGVVETPVFFPVGTAGAVKGISPDALERLGAQVMLANLYHLSLRPGIDRIEALGGLHPFTGWRRPILTDSGGYQVFSLSRLRTLDEDGVSFQSHVDGAALRFTPESVVRDQERMGVDIAMMLDECPPPTATESEVAQALDRTNRWARRAREAWREGATQLFAIVQGGVFPALRERGASELAALDFPGYAIGGVSVGESLEERRSVVASTPSLLPAAKPRYLMGVGTPEDILHAVRSGVDVFDCVLPSRNARHGFLFTHKGPLRIKNSRYGRDSRPVDGECSCPGCKQVPRALLHHLIRSGEATGLVLATLHNVRFFLDFMADLRKAIASGTTASWAKNFATVYAGDDPPERPR